VTLLIHNDFAYTKLWVQECPTKPLKALSDRVKKHKANQANNKCLLEAAEAYLNAKDGGNKLSFREIEEKFRVKRSILERFINGKQNHARI
jgi:hypothetical protein